MKAAVLTGREQVELRNVPEPQLPPGGILVKVETCAVCGTDVKMFTSGYAGTVLPFIPGHELAGTVVRADGNTAGVREGMRVAVAPNIPCGSCRYCGQGLQTACDSLQTIGVHRNGGFAEVVAVPQEALEAGCVLEIPENLSFEEAALIDPASCVFNACEISRVGPGRTLAVIGAGPAGCLSIEIGRALGAEKTFLIQRSPSRLRQAAFTNAGVYVNSSEEDATGRVLDETGGAGADAVIVACGSAEAQRQALGMAAKRGSVNFFGGLPKGSPEVPLDTNLIHYRELSVSGTHGGTSRQCAAVLAMIASGRIRAREYVTHRFALSDFRAALETARERKGLKVLVYP